MHKREKCELCCLNKPFKAGETHGRDFKRLETMSTTIVLTFHIGCERSKKNVALNPSILDFMLKQSTQESTTDFYVNVVGTKQRLEES